MILQSLAPRDRRALLAGGAVVFVLVGAFRFTPGWWQWRERTLLRAEQSLASAEELRTLARDGRAVRDSVARLDARFAGLQHALLARGQLVSPGEQLTGIVLGIAATSRALVGRTTSRGMTRDSTSLVERIQVELELTSDIAGLASLLQGLAGRPERLLIRRLAVTPENIDVPHQDIERLTIRLTVEGLVPGARKAAR